MSNHASLQIIIYESSSHGGCYKYALELVRAYNQQQLVRNAILLLPKNATTQEPNTEKILLKDNKNGKRAHFLYRHFFNPLILFNYLIKFKNPSTNQVFVLLNDFEQISAPLWAPLYKLFFKKFIFGIFLHDADRDAYPPSAKISAWCMSKIMSLMHLAFYHGTLPKRSYYQNTNTKYLQVEHGLYPPAEPNQKMFNDLTAWKKQFEGLVFIIPGHIRTEKNYLLAFNALKDNPDMALIIAGSAANSSVSVEELKHKVQKLGVSKQVLWIEKYLTEEEMSAAIITADLILLYYAASFQSQSGILNQVAPLKKLVVTGKLNNALAHTVEKYQLGWVIPPDDATVLSSLFSTINLPSIRPQWENYYAVADWNKQASMVVDLILKRNNP